MPTKNPGGKASQPRSGRSNNAAGRSWSSGMVNGARENPLATAAAVGGAVAAGVFLWSRRNQLSDQIVNLAQQVSERGQAIAYDSENSAAGDSFMAKSSSRPSGNVRSQAQIAEEALTLKELGKA